MRRISSTFVLVLCLTLMLTTTALAAPRSAFPQVIQLPNGWQPEGITHGAGTDFYVGSLANGAIYKGNLRTGEGAVLVQGATGRATTGLWYDPRSGYLFAAGGPTGAGYVFDTRTAQLVQTFILAAPGNFINDVVVTRDAAYFTNSSQPVLFKVPLLARGALPDPVVVQALPLGGDWEQRASGFNANGIDATPNGKMLVVVNTTTGFLYLVDPVTGYATQIDLGGATVTFGDGILLDGKMLYVVRNQLNQIDVIKLAPSLAEGQVVATLTDPQFRVPTTIAGFGNRLYAVNARFDVTPTPSTPYEIVQVYKVRR